MTEYKNTSEIRDPSMEEASNSPQTDLTEGVHASVQRSTGFAPAPVQVSGQVQWPLIQWFPIQGQCPTRPSQTWTQYGPPEEDGRPKGWNSRPVQVGRLPLLLGQNKIMDRVPWVRATSPNPLVRV